MAKDLNKVMLIGRLGTDPDMRYTPSGTPVTNFRLACSRRRTTQEGETREETDWFTVVSWNKLAEITSQYLNKGSRVYIEGRLQTRQWEDQNGQRRNTTEIVANDMIMLDTRQQAERQAAGQTSGGNTGGGSSGGNGDMEDLNADDIPF